MPRREVDQDVIDDDLASLSIYELHSQYPKERLLVEPIQWTARHLNLLRCDFLDTTPQYPVSPEAPQPEEVDHSLLSSLHLWDGVEEPRTEYSSQWAMAMAHRKDDTYKHIVMEELMKFHSFEYVLDPLLFRFDKKTFELTCSMFTGMAFRVAYLDVSDIDYHRRYRFSVKIRRKIKPVNPLYDPYIAGILIALAQRSQEDDLNQDGDKQKPVLGTSYQACVILVDWKNETDIHVYTAHVTATFLSKFTNPSNRPGPTEASRLNIWHTTVSYRPYASFHLRLMEALHHVPQGGKQQGDSESDA